MAHSDGRSPASRDNLTRLDPILSYHWLMAVSYNVYEAKTHLSQLLDRAAAGEEIVIARAGRPVARLVALAGVASHPRKPGAWRGKVRIAADFDELPADIEAAFRGEDS